MYVHVCELFIPYFLSYSVPPLYFPFSMTHFPFQPLIHLYIGIIIWEYGAAAIITKKEKKI